MKKYMTIGNMFGRAVKTACRGGLLSFAFSLFCLFTSSLLFSSCSMIDEDQSDCEEDFNVKYEVVLRTNLQVEINTVLRLRMESEVAVLLENMLKNIFREYAHDVDLSFYINNERRFHDVHIMDANQAVYELELPADDYRHLALANILEEERVQIEDPLQADQIYLKQEDGKYIDSHTAGLFTARENMDILSNVNQNFKVTLYMANCANALVIRTNNLPYDNMWVECCDFADGFFVNDSIFTHRSNPVIREKRVENPPANREVFYAVTFPSYDTAKEAHAGTRADDDVVEVGDEEKRIWRLSVYTRLLDGSVTRTVVYVHEPLKAGQAKVLLLDMGADGSVYSMVDEVATSVTLNWKEGLVIGN